MVAMECIYFYIISIFCIYLFIYIHCFFALLHFDNNMFMYFPHLHMDMSFQSCFFCFLMLFPFVFFLPHFKQPPSRIHLTPSPKAGVGSFMAMLVLQMAYLGYATGLKLSACNEWLTLFTGTNAELC